MSLPRYPEYKDSGVAWLGEVPGHWEVHRARAIGTFTASGIDKKFVDGEQPVKMFNYVDVYKSSDKKLRYSEDLMDTTAPREKVLEHAVREGDLLLTPSSETSDDIGHAAQVLNVPEGVVYSYHILRFRPGSSVNSTFLTYAFNSSTIRSYFSSVCTGTTRMVLVRDDFKNTALPLPFFKEQQAIAAFLDRETGKIDALIAEQRRLVELLAEKRQAVISHAVTKGLHHNARMKDSGIEWLGEVPIHWQVFRLGALFREVADEGQADRPILSVSIHDGVSDRELNDEEMDRKVTRSEDRGKYKSVEPGDLVYNMMRAWQGGFGTVEVSGMVSPAYVVARPRFPFSTEFVEQQLRSPQAVEEMRRHSRGVTDFRLRLYWDEFKSISVAMAPSDEQNAIAAFLDTETAKLDTLTAEANRAIELLQERRSALITAAVTGKIDVRALSPMKEAA